VAGGDRAETFCLRILTGRHARPQLETIARIAHACNETVGWLLDERGYSLSDDERETLRMAAIIIEAGEVR
jgi:hypothetical protein